MADPLITLAGVTVTEPRSGRRLLGPLSLRIDAGEQVLVLGPSGSGKSTLLAVLSGIVPHSVNLDLAGSVTIAGQVPAAASELAREVAMVPQDPSAAICLPVVESEMALTCENHGMNPGLIDARITEVLAAVGGSALRHSRTRQLSGGEQQRIATAAALAARPRIVLVDEPTSMLDADGVGSVLDAVRRLRRADGAVVMVDHRLNEIADHQALPPRTVVLVAGRLVADGPTDRVLTDHGPTLARLGAWLPSEVELRLAADRRAADHRAAGAASVGATAVPASTAARFAVPGTPHPGCRRSPDRGPTTGATTASFGAGHAEPLVRAESITVRRGNRVVVRSVDLTAGPGEVVALLGANGSGKSTTLRALTGLIDLADGHVHHATARVGLVLQNPEQQFIASTVAAELRAGHPHPADTPGLLRALRLTGLEAANPFRLSGGEKRRLSVATTLAMRPQLVLADEPTYGLDRHDAHRVMAALTGVTDVGGAVIVATHDLRQVAVWAQRVVVLADGEVRLSGDTAAVLASGDLPRFGIAVPSMVRWALDQPAGLAALQALEPVTQDA